MDLAGRVFSQQLDRDKPLWEIWLVEGLEDDRFALLAKTHHALVDGVSGMDIVSVLFDTSARAGRPAVRGPALAPAPAAQRRPAARRGAARARHRARRGGPHRARRVPRPAQSARRPQERRRGRGRDGVGRAQPRAAVALQRRRSAPTGASRGCAPSCATSRRSRTRSAAPSTTWCSPPWPARSGRHLRRRGQLTDGLELKAMIPVSVRSDVERGALGNRVAAMMAPLPVWCQEPLARLDLVRQELSDLKQSGQAVGAQVLTDLTGFAPPTIMDQAARLMSRQRFFNLVVTNVPGPAVPALPGGPAHARPVPDGAAGRRARASGWPCCPTTARSTSAWWATTTWSGTSTSSRTTCAPRLPSWPTSPA